MSLDTRTFILQHQILDLTLVSGTGGGGTTDHAALSNLDFASSNHTGFASSASLANYLNKDGTVQLTGDWDFGSFTISGTGDIHAVSFYGDGSNLTGIGGVGNPLEIGTDDTTKGALYLYGAVVTNGGEIRVYNAADQDSEVDYWTILSNSDELHIGSSTGSKTDIIALDAQGGGSYNCNIGTDVTLVVKDGSLKVGQDDTKQGVANIYGNATDGGGTVWLYTGANYDGTTNSFGVRVFEDNFFIGPSVGHNQAFGMDVNGNIFPAASGTYNIGTVALPYGSIYADDVYVSGSSIYLGSSVVLSEVSSDLAINTDFRLTGTNPVIKATGTTTFLYIDMPDPGKQTGNLVIRDYLENSAFQVQASGDISLYGDRMSLGGGTGTFTLYKGGSTAIIVECGGDLASFSYYDGHHDLWSLTASQGQPFGERYADQYLSGSLDVARDITVSGTIGWDTVQLSEYNNTDLAINSDLRFSGALPTIYGSDGSNTNFTIQLGQDTKNNVTQLFIKDYNAINQFVLNVDESDRLLGNIEYYGNMLNFAGDTDINIRCAWPTRVFRFETTGTPGQGGYWSFYNVGQGGDRATIDPAGNLDAYGNITASGTIGWDTVQLSEYNNTDLAINSDIRLTAASPTLDASSQTNTIMYFKGAQRSKGSTGFQWHNHAGTQMLLLTDEGTAEYDLTLYGDLRFAGNFQIVAPGSTDLELRMADNGGTYKVSFQDSDEAEVAYIDSNGTISGTGDIYCNDLHTAGSSIYLGALQLSYDGSKISIQTHIDTGQSVVLGTDAHAGDPGGADNVILGYQAGYYCDGDYNVVLGKEAAYAHSGSTAGDYGVFLGYRAGYSLQSGNYNVCIGGQAGLSLTGGSDNVCIGGLAGHQMTSTSYNVCIGSQAGRYNTGTGNVFLGSNAGRNNTGTNSIFIGNRAGYNVGAVSNVLYIAVSDTATPLIYGEFDTPMLTFNGDIYFGANTISGTGDIYCGDLYTSGSSIYIGTGEIKSASGNVELYYNGLKRFETTTAGAEVSVPGSANTFLDIACTAGYWGQFRLVDGSNVKYEIGKTSDNNFYVYDYARSNNVIRTNAEELTLYYGGSPKLATSNTGVTVTGDLDVTGDVLPTASGISDVGGEVLPYVQVYLADQLTGDTYSITVVSGTLTATLV